MISPFDRSWYTNFDWLFDEPGMWLDYMKITCRPVWVLFGDFTQQKTEDAIVALSVVSQERGYNSSNNPNGDITFLFVNTRLYVPLEDSQDNNVGAPSAASWASVRSTPTHVIYIAGMEYQRHWGLVGPEIADDLCNHYAEIMSIFRQNAGLSETCLSVSSWNGQREPRPTILESTYRGSKATTGEGTFSIIEVDPTAAEGSKATAGAGTFSIVEVEPSPVQGSKATAGEGSFSIVEVEPNSVEGSKATTGAGTFSIIEADPTAVEGSKATTGAGAFSIVEIEPNSVQGSNATTGEGAFSITETVIFFFEGSKATTGTGTFTIE